MKHIRISLVIYISIFCFFLGQLQSQEKVNVNKIDFFEIDYKHLSKDLKITISPEDFDALVLKYKFIPERIVNYKDSIGVIMMGEFDNWKLANSAKLRLTYSWERLSYHLWMDTDALKNLAYTVHIDHPYKLKSYIIEHPNDADVEKILSTLKNKFKTHNLENDFDNMTIKVLLNYAMYHNPQRHDLWERKKYLKKHGKAAEPSMKFEFICMKKNCCLNKTKN